jgi:hypothetical protein
MPASGGVASARWTAIEQGLDGLADGGHFGS